MPDKDRIIEIFDTVASELPLRVPISTYRLQFNKNFTFVEARHIVQYLNALGITDVYSSPYFRAQPRSSHGYDVIDHNSLSPEIGTSEDHAAFSSELRELGMGQIADIVPNHMSITGSGNEWWNDILENGQCSPYANFFDIDWKPLKEELEDKVILPILGGLYGDILEAQEIRLTFEEGAFFVHYFEHRLPIDPSTYELVLAKRQDALENALSSENHDYQEYLSILTALKNLPHRTAKDKERIFERLREKEVAKKRLRILYESSSLFREFADENVLLFNGVRGRPESFDDLDELLSAQVYRLAFWRVATEEINYRRFFDINDLGAIRIEDEKVFGEAHRLIFELIRDKLVTGLRVDHPDGLHNPSEYFRRLQEGCFVALCMGRFDDGNGGERYREMYKERLSAEPDGNLKRPVFVVGEKILMESERLTEDWPIFGTTGYGFMNTVNGVLIDSSSAKEIDSIYRRFTKQTNKFSDLFYEKKKLIMETSMSGEINVLGHHLNRISERDRHFRDFTLNNLVDAIVEVIAFFPVYRTYITSAGASESDRRYIEAAISKAKRRSSAIIPLVFDFIRKVLLLEYERFGDQSLRNECLDFTMKFQQLTGPVMAKGIEDTAFYNYNRLMSLNEVGGNPERIGITVEAFHGQCIQRHKHWPHTLVATSTHDSKRSEDVRARINVITEMPGEWRECLIRWARLNRKFKRNIDGQLAPDRNDEYLLYQTLLGAWPPGDAEGASLSDFRERIKQYMVKASREAKNNSNWLNPNVEYEEALTQFVDKILNHSVFADHIRNFRLTVSHFGMFNSLSQTLLKITSPGVPDFYQGTELWTFTLVDPDNRNPVDFAQRMKLLENIRNMESSMARDDLVNELLKTKEDGRIKLYLTYKTLNFRRENRDIFTSGEYMPLHISGKHSERIIAFAYSAHGSVAITVVPRLVAGLASVGAAPLGEIWEDTLIHLPPEISHAGYRNIFTEEVVSLTDQNGDAVIRASDVFNRFPAALLVKQHG